MTALERHGIAARVAWTLHERSALVSRSWTDERCRCLVAAGGDGTVADLVNEGPRVPVTVMPAGTENLFARHFGLRGRPEQVATTIRQGRRIALDVGVVGDRRFTLMAGIGFDADVVARHHQARTRVPGGLRTNHRARYLRPVLESSWRYRFPKLALRLTDEAGRVEALSGTSVFVFNLPRYALGLPFAPTASGHDGLLDLVVFREPGPLRALGYLSLVLLRMHLKRADVHHRRVRSVEVMAHEPVPVQLDGDPGGWVLPGQPWTVGALPAAVEVLVPRLRP